MIKEKRKIREQIKKQKDKARIKYMILTGR
jgi:hypothetical protein